MENSILGECLILFLLFINCSRIFFLKYGKIDTLAILSPVILILSILQIFVWGIEWSSVLILFIAIIVFITNFRAFLRFASGLFIDHYSIAFKIGAFISLLLTLATSAIIFYFLPKSYKLSDYNVEKEIVRLSGSFSQGFEPSKTFQIANGEISIFKPITKKIESNVVLITDKRARLADYMPYILQLSSSGNKIYVAEFYSNELKWYKGFGNLKYFRNFIMLLDFLFTPNHFENQKEFYSFNCLKECNAIFSYLKDFEKEEVPLYFVVDWMANLSIDDFYDFNKEKINGIYKLADDPEYKAKGFGFITLTNPILAMKLGYRDYTEDIDSIVKRTLERFNFAEEEE